MKLKEAIMGRLQQQLPTEQLESSAKQNPKRKASQDRPTPKQDKLRLQIEETRVMNKKNGWVAGYSANTFHGLVRTYNEDRVSIILNITRPDSLQKWPKCSYFAVFDGHGGSLCSDFLRDNMHKYIIEDRNFPWRPIDAIKNGFSRAQAQFKKLAQSSQPVNKSGSCAIVVIIIDKLCYVANVGDSRAIMSAEHGKKTISLSNDHKPNCATERQRIILNGGTVYQSMLTTKNGNVLPGPYRVNPGRLSVSRAFGDIQAKDEQYEGLPGVLISQPEITTFQLQSGLHDFILIGCDGIFDKLSNEEVVETIWRMTKDITQQQEFLSRAVTAVLQQSMLKKSMDNVTAVLILVDNEESKTKENQPNQVNMSYEPKKSSSSWNLLKQQKIIPLRPRQQTNQTVKQEIKDSYRSKRPIDQSQSKENTNTGNYPSQSSNKKQEEDSPSLMRLKKKSSVQLSSKRLDLLKKTTELQPGKKKAYEYIRY